MRLRLLGLLLSLLGLSMLGCARDDARRRDARRRERPERLDRRVVLPASPVGSAPSASPGGTGAPIAMPGPYRQRMAEAVKLNKGCVTCHPQQAAQWRGSHHQRSNLNPAYRRAFAIEPTAFCRGCHAPEANFKETPPAEVSALGVSCVTCHIAEGDVVLAAASSDLPDALVGGAPHPLRRSRAFAHTGGCANCHEFHFPGRRGDDDGQYMQTTVREHQRSPAAGDSCASCHMPLIDGGGRSHAFAQVRDQAWLRRNLTAKAERSGGTLHVTLQQPRPGHAFPSGDLFRRLEVGCEWLDAAGEPVARQVQHLARHFPIAGGRPGRRLVRDDRVFFEPRVVAFELPEASRVPLQVRWWVSYQRVATVGMGKDPAAASVESTVALHGGTSPWDDVPSP